MFERVAGFFGDTNNFNLIRHVGYSMGWFGMLVGVVAILFALLTAVVPLGLLGACLALVSFILLPVTDINFPKRGYY